MSIADHVNTIRRTGFVRVNIPGEDDQYEIRAHLDADEPAITLDAVDVLIAADPYDARAWKIKTLRCPTCGNLTLIGYLLVNERDEHQHTHYVCTYWVSSKGMRTSFRCGWSGYAVPGWNDVPAETEAPE